MRPLFLALSLALLACAHAQSVFEDTVDPQVFVKNGSLWLAASLTSSKNIVLQASEVIVKGKMSVELDPLGKTHIVINDIPNLLDAQSKAILALTSTVDALRAQTEAVAALHAQEVLALKNRVSDLEALTARRNKEFEDRIIDLETACLPGVEYEVRPATLTSTRVCALVTTCGQGSFETRAPTLTSDRVCSNHTACAPGYYEYIPPTSITDRVCKAWSVCAADQFEIVPPSSTADRLCKAITLCSVPSTFELIAPTSKSDRQCSPTTQCTSAQFQFAAPTLTTDRVCRTVSPACTLSQYEAQSPITSGSNQRDRVCAPISICNGTQYEASAPTLSTDRVCLTLRTCTASEYQSTAPTATSNRVCQALTTCTASQFQVTAPTATSDRVCQNIRPACAVGEIETPPTPTSDRRCAPSSGCSSYSIYSFKVNDKLWLCSDGAVSSKNFERVARVCNEAGGFRLPSVGPMTVRGRPDNTAWRAAASQMQSLGHDYFITGHPTRGAGWAQWTSGWAGINGLGYIQSGETVNDGNWMALTDGNNAEYRDWPSANAPDVPYHNLASVCANLADIPGVYTFASDHIWRK